MLQSICYSFGVLPSGVSLRILHANVEGGDAKLPWFAI